MYKRQVYTSKKEFIAEGHFQIGSIAVRVLSFRQEPINHDFWKRKLEIAYDMRCAIGIAINPVNDTYRLVHGEGDNLPGPVSYTHLDVYKRQEKDLCKHFGVQALPTLFFIPVGGKPIVEVGATPEKYVQIIEEQLLK